MKFKITYYNNEQAITSILQQVLDIITTHIRNMDEFETKSALIWIGLIELVSQDFSFYTYKL